jgi:hypothetical protein
VAPHPLWQALLPKGFYLIFALKMSGITKNACCRGFALYSQNTKTEKPIGL